MPNDQRFRSVPVADAIEFLASGQNPVTGAATPYDRDLKQAGMYAVPPGTSQSAYTTSANQGRIVRFVPSRPMTVTNIAFVVTTAAGSDDACDVAIYSSALARLGSAGATSGKLNALGAKQVNLSASVALAANTIYYVGFSCGAIGTSAAALGGLTYATGPHGELFGTSNGQYEFGTMASAHPLPDPFVRAQSGSGPLLVLRES